MRYAARNPLTMQSNIHIRDYCHRGFIHLRFQSNTIFSLMVPKVEAVIRKEFVEIYNEK